MISVLVIDNEKLNKNSLYKALDSFSNIDVTQVDTIDEALELFSKRYIEMLFLDCSPETAEKLYRFKLNNSDVISVAFYKELHEDIKEKTLRIGINDCLHYDTDPEILLQRIHNYIDLVKLKKENLFYSEAINLFDQEINKHFLTFKLNSDESRVQFSDYFGTSYFDRYQNMRESIDLLYAFSSWMFLNHRTCEVIKETNDINMYLTLQPIDYMSDGVINNLLEKHGSGTNYKVDNHKLSLKLVNLMEAKETSNTSKLDDETKSILSKTHFNKISAIEFVESTAIEIVSKLEDLSELEDRMDEAIIGFEKNPTIEQSRHLSQEILEYVEIIELLVDFQHLAFALKTLANAIENLQQEHMQDKEIQKFTTLMLHLLNDLSTWRENIFIKQEANDIHYLDSSLLSSCLQIESIFEKEKIEEDEDDFELF